MHRQPGDLASDPTLNEMAQYRFPYDKLKRKLSSKGRSPLLLVACGRIPIRWVCLSEAPIEVQATDAEFDNYGADPSEVGSFSPITYLHLRMFELASDHIKFNTDFEVIGGYLSPSYGAAVQVSALLSSQGSRWPGSTSWRQDYFAILTHARERGLAPSWHRVAMCSRRGCAITMADGGYIRDR